ncbi:MAG TPA: GNAT family N-acetyltransferase [Methanotrichaceae archaeon]|nr:GNAT family N-acetyltransferase [Methanotrichaceae archaeon]
MISIRPFENDDNSRMLEIEKLCPQGDENCALGVDKTDITARYKMYDNWNILVAEVAGRIAGWVGLTLKQHRSRDGNYVYAYLPEVMVHPDFRGSGVATMLAKEAEKKARDMGSDYIYCYIYGPNRASKSLFEGLSYVDMITAKSPEILTYKKADISPKISIKQADKKDIPDAVSLINDYNKGRMHFVPYTAESFESNAGKIPGYGLENFWIASKDGGEIVACAGLWDCSTMGDLYYAREPLMWKVMGGLFGFLNHFTRMPKIAAEGEHFRLSYITDHAFQPAAPEAMSELIGHLNNISLEAGKLCIFSLLDPQDRVIDIMKKFKPQIEEWHVYAKPFEGALPQFNPFYVDMRDTVL